MSAACTLHTSVVVIRASSRTMRHSASKLKHTPCLRAYVAATHTHTQAHTHIHTHTSGAPPTHRHAGMPMPAIHALLDAPHTCPHCSCVPHTHQDPSAHTHTPIYTHRHAHAHAHTHLHTHSPSCPCPACVFCYSSPCCSRSKHTSRQQHTRAGRRQTSIQAGTFRSPHLEP